jgi:hypothetical protein
MTQQGTNMSESPINFRLDSITDPTTKAKIKEILDQTGIPKTVVGENASMQNHLVDILQVNQSDQRNWVVTEQWLTLSAAFGLPTPRDNSPKSLSAGRGSWLSDTDLTPLLGSLAQCDVPLGDTIQGAVGTEPSVMWIPWFKAV